MAGIDIRRSADRFRTSTDWLESRHSFAFGPHYDPANVGFGPLIAVNSDLVQPGPGYVAHLHAGVEILSWVTEGVLEHVAGGRQSMVRPGQLQYLSAGRGVEHAERSGSPTEPVRVLQLWLSGRADGEPTYSTTTIPDGDWVLAASSRHRPPVRLRHAEAELYIGRPRAGVRLELPAASRLYLFVVRGEVLIGPDRLGPEDEARLTEPVTVAAAGPAEILVWVFD